MSNIMTVALQFTAVDMMSGIAARVKNSIMGLGNASEKVKRDFDEMNRNISAGLKALAASKYIYDKIHPGISAAGDLQEAMLDVKMNIAGSAGNARELNAMLMQVKRTAIDVSANAPFSAEDVVRIQNSLLKAGMDIKDIVGESGAAFAATALASLSGEAPEIVGDALANIGAVFNFKGGDYKQFSDWLTRVDDAAATNLPALIQGLRMSGASAAALGVSANDAITSLGALAPLGERAGSSFSNFLLSFSTRRDALKKMGIDVFVGGKFVGMEKAVDMLKEKFGAIKDDGERLGLLTKAFGEEGGRAANMFINAEKSFKEIKKSAADALGLSDKLRIWAEGFNASLKKLGGTAKSTLATLFDPLLAPLIKINDLLNSVIGKIGALAEKHKSLSYGASYGLAAGALGAGAYGIYKLFKGGMAGSRVLKGMGGLKGMLAGMGGTAAGIAKGKAVEAATGVQPVFVTNWPANGLGVTPAVDVPGGGKIPGAAKLAALAPVIGTVGAVIAATVATTTAVSSLVDALRGGSGDNWINKTVSGGEQLEVFKGKWGDIIYDMLHRQEKIKQKPVDVGGKIQIEFTETGARLKKIQSNNPGVKMDVSTGLMMGAR